MIVTESKVYLHVRKNRQFWKKLKFFLQSTHNGEQIKNFLKI